MHTFAFDEERQRLYVFIPKNCRVAIYKEALIVKELVTRVREAIDEGI